MCGGAKSVSGMHCRQCSLMIKGSIAVVGAMLQNGWASLADIAREASISVRGVYRAVDRINSSGGEVQVRYVWNGKANVAMLNLVKTPSWYHP